MDYKIMIVDDHILVRKGIKAILSEYNPGWELFEAENGVKAVLLAGKIQPDMVLMDFNMPKLDGLRAARQVISQCPGIKVIMVTQHSDAALIHDFERAGIRAFIHKNASDTVFMDILLKVKEGYRNSQIPDYRIFANDTPGQYLHGSCDQPIMDSLSTREKEIFQLMTAGVRPAQISERLCISPRTLDTHKLSIFRKCNVHSTQELLSFAYKEKLFEVE
jgi:two-component system, NarL family, response regulator NreC